MTDNLVLKGLRLLKEDWIKLANLVTILKPLQEFTKRVSFEKPSLHMLVRMYDTLYKQLTSIVRKEGYYESVRALAQTTHLRPGYARLKALGGGEVVYQVGQGP